VGFSANSAALFAERLTHPGFQVDLRVYPLEVRADPRSWNRWGQALLLLERTALGPTKVQENA